MDTSCNKNPLKYINNPVAMSASDKQNTMLSGELADIEAQRNDENKSIGCSCSNFSQKASNVCSILWTNPRITFVTFSVLAILCGGGLGVVYYVKSTKKAGVRAQALQLAHDTGRWFCKFQNLPAL